MSRLAFRVLGVKTRVTLAFGSNLGDREKTIRGALRQLTEHKKIKLIALSSLHETTALTEAGEDEVQPRYLNAVAILETSLSPKKLHKICQSIENNFGRIRLVRWAPRTLDIDIITFGTEFIETKKLIVPHPRAHERSFVLEPWLEIDPDATIPGRGRVAHLIEAAK